MNRLQTALFLVGFLFLSSAVAQDNGSSGASGSSPDQGAGGDQGTPTPSATAPAAAAAAPAQPATPIVMPGVYGSSPISLTPGQGRFAKPPYDFTFSLQQGYDSNIYTTSSNATASAVTNTQLGLQLQSATPRTVYTVDASFGMMYYWHRPGTTPEQYTGSLNLLFFHRVNPRLDLSAVANIAYLTQPNFSALNGPTNQASGNYILASSRLNASYQWSARIQTNTSYSLNATLYQQQSAQTGNLFDNTLGNEFRFLLTPRLTLVGEVRADATTYPNQPGGNSISYFLLMGGDYTFSSRLNSTLRLGEELRDYSTGGTQSSPYGEFTISYIYGHQSTLSWSNFYGLQDSAQQSEKISSFRTGINLNHVLTAKMTALFGLNYNIQTTNYQSTLGLPVTASPPTVVAPIFFQGPGLTETQDQISATIGLQYLLTPKISLSITNTFIQVVGTPSSGNYIRNQTFLGGTYTF